jgi:signal transduction histidine kinase
MNTSTRLILWLTLAVAVVMAAAGYVMLRQREQALDAAMRNELRAHIQTLRIALEDHYRAGRQQEAQLLIDHLRQNPRVYCVALFDAAGGVLMISNPQAPDEVRFFPEVQQVLAMGEPLEFERDIRGQEIYSIISPVQLNTTQRVALEIVQPQTAVNSDLTLARWETLLVTFVLAVALSLVVFFVLRRSLTRSINTLLESAIALGQGDLKRRVALPGKDNEFARLAQEFNRMADNLEQQRAAFDREAEQRVALERELRHSERLVAVGRLASGIAHELGTPLNVIDAHAARVLNTATNLEEKQRRSLQTIRRQVESISRIVRQLLNLARPYQLRPEDVNLHHLLHHVGALLEAEATRTGVQIETHVPPQLQVRADQDSLQQVFLNLYHNGLQAMPQGGRLRVESLSPPVCKEGKLFAAVQISDTGSGIAPEHLPHIFDPFFTTKDVGSGTGLGLTVAHRIVEEHGGWIEAANQPNNGQHGAVFTVYLPQADWPTDTSLADS